MKKTLVIGGGAAGMAAAIAAAQRGEAVTLLERNPKTLKKLGVTGNGRGNVLNAGPPIYYGDAAFAQAVLQAMPYERVATFLEELGIPLRQEAEGRVYPAALQASVVVEALRLRAEQLGVQAQCRTRVLALFRDGDGFTAEAEESPLADPHGKKGRPAAAPVVFRKYCGDRVIVTVGGAAAPAHGTDGTAYGLLTNLGHSLVSPYPALCALLTDKRPIGGLAGQRIRAALTLTSPKGALLHSTEGEALFAEDGVSGIAAMQLARFATEGCLLHMDLRPGLGLDGESKAALRQRLQALIELRKALPLSELCTGMMTQPLARALLKAAGITGLERPVGSLEPNERNALADILVNFSLDVKGVRGFDSAQVTAGGIATAAFDPLTMESRLQKGLYAAGEILDVDGDCGGFNLMFAFAGGLLAGGYRGR